MIVKMMPGSVGFFGKLPAHGDFIHRNLPAHFINFWDQWLQCYVSGSREQLGEQWLDIYLTSPIWRFFFSTGVIDDSQWAGIILPSVDRVGRYFPFSIVAQTDGRINPMNFIARQNNWYQVLEETALAALDGQMVLDELAEKIQHVEIADMDVYKPVVSTVAEGIVVEIDAEEQTPMKAFPSLLDAFITQSLTSYSAWTTRGSQLVAPCTFIVHGLPGSGKVAAMLDGRWEQWGWSPHLHN